MDDLIAFLRGRLDEDEQTARAADPGLNYLIGAVEYAYDKVELDQRHAIRHNPARVLAEVDAKRRIVDECAYWIDKINTSGTDKYPYPNLAERGEVVLPVLTLLALPYADHPDYRDEWRP